MADIRINALATTAASTASDDYIAIDGSANGTRKLDAFSPTFGGNLTVSGTGSHVFGTTNTVTLAAGTVTATGIGKIAGIQVTGASTAATGVGVEVLWDNTSAIIQGFNRTGSVFTPILVGGSTVGLQIGGVTKFGLDASGNATLAGNLTVSGTGTSSVAGNLGIGTTSPSGFLANKLVIATGGSSNEGLTIYTSNNTANTSLWFADSTTGSGLYAGGIDYQHATNEMVFYTNSQGNVRITSGGNFLIGTTIDGGQKLQVSGTAAISGALSIGNTVQTAASVASTHKVTISIGGSTYYLLATNV